MRTERYPAKSKTMMNRRFIRSASEIFTLWAERTRNTTDILKVEKSLELSNIILDFALMISFSAYYSSFKNLQPRSTSCEWPLYFISMQNTQKTEQHIRLFD